MKGIFVFGEEIDVATDVLIKIRMANVKLQYIVIPELAHDPTPRELLLEYLREAKKQIDPQDRARGLPLLSVEMPCGQKVEYANEDVIPLQSVPCPCGSTKHWIISYESSHDDDDPGANAMAAEFELNGPIEIEGEPGDTGPSGPTGPAQREEGGGGLSIRKSKKNV